MPRTALSLFLLFQVSSALAQPAEQPAPGPRAVELYDRLCLACHGESGDGRGPAAPWLWPAPRDLSSGEFKWRSTPLGSPPTRADLEAAIRFGAPGTSMPGFAHLAGEDIDALVAAVERLSGRPLSDATANISLPRPDNIGTNGAELYGRLGCVVCHGEQGRGDGPATRGKPELAPYDWTTAPLRRPTPPGTDVLASIVTTLATGVGTTMPSYRGAVSDQDLWAVAAYVQSLRPSKPTARSFRARTETSSNAIDRDKKEKHTRAGYWPGNPASRDAIGWSKVLTLNPQEALSTPAERSLSAKQCARCHPQQHQQWRGSLHARAASPGLMAQLIPMETHGRGASLESCQRCHAPLAEQLPTIRPAHDNKSGSGYRTNAAFDPTLRDEGITCAACHVRGGRRHGPPRTDQSKLLALPGYPVESLAIYERSDFCLGCHQLPPRLAVNGAPLLNTYREWLEGPYMARGIQCQHCHMASRDHQWKGVHDRETFQQGIKVETLAVRSKTGTVTVRTRLWNIGAGHFLPTTPTPAAWIDIELMDEKSRPIRGAHADKRIGRHIEYRKSGWVEIEDTRVPPGENVELATAWKNGRTADAAFARVTVRVAPDEYYERFYRKRLGRAMSSAEEQLYRQALFLAEANHYLAHDQLVPVVAE